MKRSSMRLAQLVRTPSVQNRSFCAIGMPVKAVAVPSAMRRSAASAWDSARSAVTVMKLLICGSSLSMRARKCWVSSRELNCRVRRPSLSFLRLEVCMCSLDS